MLQAEENSIINDSVWLMKLRSRRRVSRQQASARAPTSLLPALELSCLNLQQKRIAYRILCCIASSGRQELIVKCSEDRFSVLSKQTAHYLCSTFNQFSFLATEMTSSYGKIRRILSLQICDRLTIYSQRAMGTDTGKYIQGTLPRYHGFRIVTH